MHYFQIRYFTNNWSTKCIVYKWYIVLEWKNFHSYGFTHNATILICSMDSYSGYSKTCVDLHLVCRALFWVPSTMYTWNKCDVGKVWRLQAAESTQEELWDDHFSSWIWYFPWCNMKASSMNRSGYVILQALHLLLSLYFPWFSSSSFFLSVSETNI
jgi:hypothetical protein